MSARPIGDLVKPIVSRAVGLARLQCFIGAFDPDERQEWIDHFEANHTVDWREADLLRAHNAEDCT